GGAAGGPPGAPGCRLLSGCRGCAARDFNRPGRCLAGPGQREGALGSPTTGSGPAPVRHEATVTGGRSGAARTAMSSGIPADMSARLGSPGLVGRGEDLGVREAALGRARAGGPSAVLIGGEAGIGKSRLMSEFTAGAAEAGARVLAGGCLDLGTEGVPFAPFAAMLRALVRELG